MSIQLVKQEMPYKHYIGLASEEADRIIANHNKNFPKTKVQKQFNFANQFFNLTLYK